MSWRPDVKDPNETEADDPRILCPRCRRTMQFIDGRDVCFNCGEDIEDIF